MTYNVFGGTLNLAQSINCGAVRPLSCPSHGNKLIVIGRTQITFLLRPSFAQDTELQSVINNADIKWTSAQ